MPAPVRPRPLRFALLLALGLMGATPAPAQQGWPDPGWSARCASTSVLTRLSSVSRGWVRPADCLFSYVDPDGTDRVLLVSAETRRAVEGVMDDISRWYARRGFPVPRVRRVGEPPLVVTEDQWRDGLVAVDLLPHDRGRSIQAFEILLDPMPDAEGAHDHAEGFYSPTLRAMVVRLEPVEPADPGGSPPAGLAAVDPDTMAHELFHAISRGLHDGNVHEFVEEGLAEMYGTLYAAEESGRPGPHPLTARFGDGRFSRAPLMSLAGNDPYDTAPFWRYIHTRLGTEADARIVQLLGQFDLTVAKAGSGAVDAWLRGLGWGSLNQVWAEFLQHVSREATRAGVMDTLIACRDATLAPSDSDPERIFEREVESSGTQRYTARCLRLTLPLPDERRTLRIEGLNGEVDVPGLRIVLDGVDLIGQPQVLAPGVTDAELIVFPWRDDAAVAPILDMQPGFRVVVEGLAEGCQADLQALRRAPAAVLDRVAAGAGDWHDVARSYSLVGPRPNCRALRDEHQMSGLDRPVRLAHDGGVLVLPDATTRLVPFLRPGGMRAMAELADLCGPLMQGAAPGGLHSPDDWVRAADPDPQYFQVELDGTCNGYAVMGPTRAAIAILVFHFVNPDTGFQTPEQWEVTLYQRPD